MMAGLAGLVVLATVITGTVAQVSVRGVALTKGGERQEYMNLGSDDLSYRLECLVDARPSDVVSITWSLNTLADVYTWVAATGSVTVKEPLKEHVRTALEGVPVGPDIQFTSPTPSMRGLYVCSVYHNRDDLPDNPVKGFFNLQMYAFFQEDYKISASLEGCTIRWNFSTPRIYPRPVVRCGFWATSSGEMVSQVSGGGGLVYRQDVDLTWRVFAQDSPLQVRDVPRGTTLQCSTQVPIANYSRQTELSVTPSSQTIYAQVEDRGCPALPPLKANMDVRVRGCWYNCRDECHQIAGGSYSSPPAEADYRCDPGFVAKWGLDDRAMPEWRLKVRCDETRHSWLSPDGSPAMALRLPSCLYSGATGESSSTPLLVLTSLVTWLPWVATLTS